MDHHWGQKLLWTSSWGWGRTSSWGWGKTSSWVVWSKLLIKVPSGTHLREHCSQNHLGPRPQYPWSPRSQLAVWSVLLHSRVPGSLLFRTAGCTVGAPGQMSTPSRLSGVEWKDGYLSSPASLSTLLFNLDKSHKLLLLNTVNGTNATNKFKLCDDKNWVWMLHHIPTLYKGN